MAATTFNFDYNIFQNFNHFRRRIQGRGLWFGLILLGALVSFEMFNFSTTEYALQTLLGEHDALGLATWAKILAIAFCGIDFAGLSRLFTPETGTKEPKEIWFLTGTWLLGTSMNAVMTWWAVATALSSNPILGNELLSRADILHYGPIFIAVLVWMTRILIIGTFAFAGDHIFSTAFRGSRTGERSARPARRESRRSSAPIGAISSPRAVPKPSATTALPSYASPVASSSYAKASAPAMERRSTYNNQRSLFGSGAGSRQTDTVQTTAPVQAPVIDEPAPRPKPMGFNTERIARTEEPRVESKPVDTRPARPVNNMPKWAASRTSSSANSSNNRASTVRTVSKPVAPEPAEELELETLDTMELEYVDFD